jgi:hypothetical protein
MFTTGSKLLIGATVAAIVAAVVYGVTQDGTLGTIGLISAAVALAFLAALNVWVRDSTVPPNDDVALTTCAAARRAPGGSLWPLVGAAGVATVAVGLVTAQPVVVLGLALVLASIIEWMVQAWSERASADPAFNDEIRERVASPLELPILAGIGVGVVIYAFSRIMLNLTKSGTVVAFSVVAALLLLVGFLFAYRPRVASGTVAGVCSVAALALIAGGTVAGVDGEREMHPHETTGDLAAAGECGTEETEADEKASQTVSAKSSVSATIVLDADGTLTFDQPGPDPSSSVLTLPRSNPNNVLFRNESPEERRLVVNAGPIADTETERVLCTALVEEGGVQLLTVVFDKPSFAVDEPFRFTVPGVDTAEITVVVP